jgi:nitrate/TMAO reductase-like tetraheme cytochrome c subunit
MPDTCNDCHSTQTWIPVTLGPDQHKWFPLQNKHRGPACTDCHTKGFRPGDTPNDCNGCHQKDYAATTSPPHVGFPTDCRVCHNDSAWQPSIFQHPWPLTNKHATIACADCHKGSPPKWAGMATDCAGCHQADYDGAQNPIHKPIPPTTGMLIAGGRTCEDCHTSGGGAPIGGWRPTKFTHPATPFSLTGAHADPARVSCNDCHQAPLPKGTAPRGYDAKTFEATTCVACHQAEFATATPSHTGFPTECRVCHSTDVFKGATVHPEATFALQPPSKHAGINCVDCHQVTRGPSKAGANVDCVTCHGFSGGAWTTTHALPPLDQRHLTNGGMAACPPGQLPSSTNMCFPNTGQVVSDATICRTCHPGGKI